MVSIARSPSSAIAVVAEQRADGPFTQTVLGVTMVTDVAVIVLFGGAVELATLALGAEAFDAGSMAARLLLRTLAKLALSVALGALLAAALHLLLRAPAPPPLRPPALLLLGWSAFALERADATVGVDAHVWRKEYEQLALVRHVVQVRAKARLARKRQPAKSAKCKTLLPA